MFLQLQVLYVAYCTLSANSTQSFPIKNTANDNDQTINYCVIAKGDKLMFLGNWDVDVDSRETLTLDADCMVLPLTADLERAINRGTRNCD